MSLTTRITLLRTSNSKEEAEDIFGNSLGVLFTEQDITAQHGDNDHTSLLYTSPHLPKPINIALPDPEDEDDRNLQSHYLWNSSLLLAELIEAGSLGLEYEVGVPTVYERGVKYEHEDENGNKGVERVAFSISHFNITNLHTLELGSGTALPSIVASLLGAQSITATDYPSTTILSTLKSNIAVNCLVENSPLGTLARAQVSGHAWGDISDENDFARKYRGKFDRLFVCDCLWMPWQHWNLQKSIAHFLKPLPSPTHTGGKSREEACAWVVGGFHTGRANVRSFFDEVGLARHGLEVERIWERDCDGVERAWVGDRGAKDLTVLKRWLVIGVLRRKASEVGDGVS
ncbi:hypothetical protein F5Y18DRAFT_439252 [Xylariaceae sp. FL1019]|nr:hypothetical protein F5Y18DRAFT_439252 [Xylariaceae sp. FL1019]